jgi:hypothetical protein
MTKIMRQYPMIGKTANASPNHNRLHATATNGGPHLFRVEVAP